MHYLECSKTQRRTRKEVRARRCTRKEVGLENALPWMVEGSKVLLKEGRVRKRTTLGMGNERW